MINTTTVTTNIPQESDNDPVSSHETTSLLMWQIFPPILITVGTVGNILSIIVLSRKTLRQYGSSRYLICLAVADLLVLYTGLLPQWVVNTFNTNTHNRDSFICKVSLWMVYFSLDLSAWILVSVTVERAISVWKLHRVKTICTNKVFGVNITVLVVILLVINGHFLLGFDIIGNETDDLECSSSLSVEYEQYQSRIFPWIDLVLFFLGPFLCHLVGNTVIIIALFRATRTMAQYSLENTRHVENRQKQVLSMTVLLLCTNAVHVICTLPISMYFIQDAIYLPKPTAERRLLYTCLHVLMYLNNSINFITYMVCGRSFREGLCALCRRKSLRPVSSINLAASGSSLSTSQTFVTSYKSTIM